MQCEEVWEVFEESAMEKTVEKADEGQEAIKRSMERGLD